MKKVKVTLSIPVKVIRNTRAGSPNDQWAKIVRLDNNQLLHIGQIPYIRKVAKEKYNVIADF